MRVVGGKYKGRVLCGFEGNDIRPTSDMVRESLFNILQFKIPDCEFLDLFCGTGAMGIEAASRGAKKVVLNDLSKKSLAVVNKNLSKLGNPPEIEVSNKDAKLLLETTAQKFDVVYIDPPYKGGYNTVSVSGAKQVLKDNGIIILESEEPFNDCIDGLIKFDERKYGRARLTFFKRE